VSHGAPCCMRITKWFLGNYSWEPREIIAGNCFWHITQVEVEVDGVAAARALGPAGVELVVFSSRSVTTSSCITL
jgi:hypothetical protein